jgi:hypothetical protein
MVPRCGLRAQLMMIGRIGMEYGLRTTVSVLRFFDIHLMEAMATVGLGLLGHCYCGCDRHAFSSTPRAAGECFLSMLE